MSVNRAAAKKRLLVLSNDFRNGKFTRVAKDVLDHLERVLEEEMVRIVRGHPSIGCTLMMESRSRKKNDDDEVKY